MDLAGPSGYRFMAPRLTLLVSTIDKAGATNCAPFSFCMPVSADPPMAAIASAHKRHTLANIRETKEFVLNLPPEELVAAVWLCGNPFPKGVSEITEAGLTPVASKMVAPPRLAECAAWFECRLEWEKDAGDHSIVVGRIVAAEVKDEFVEDGGFAFEVAKPLLHLGGVRFTVGERRILVAE